MADKRGGYRQPSDKRPKVAGPGKASRRTDNQPIQVANVQDSEDLQVGDRQKLENAQRIAPLGRTRPPRVAPAPPRGGGSAALPPHVFEGQTSRPEEPITAGLDFGPGPGSEAIAPPPPETDQEIVLDFLATKFNDQAAAQLLSEIRNSRAVPDVPMEQGPIASTSPVEAPEPEPIELDVPEEEVPEEEIPEEPVEEPVV